MLLWNKWPKFLSEKYNPGSCPVGPKPRGHWGRNRSFAKNRGKSIWYQNSAKIYKAGWKFADELGIFSIPICIDQNRKHCFLQACWLWKFWIHGNCKFHHLAFVSPVSFVQFLEIVDFRNAFIRIKVIWFCSVQKHWVLSLFLLSNASICLFKFGCFVTTRSASMFSETLHSLADTCNQLLLLWGINESLKVRSPVIGCLPKVGALWLAAYSASRVVKT